MLSDDEIVKAMARGMFGDLHWTEQSRQTAQAALAAQRAMGLVVVPVGLWVSCRALSRCTDPDAETQAIIEICEQVDLIAATQGEMK
jgi:hypothetical protein